MLKKLKIIAIIAVLILVLIFLVCFLRPIRAKDKVDFDQINRIVIIDGGDGTDKTITDAYGIALIKHYFNNLTLYHKVDFKSYGYKYGVDMYANDQLKYNITYIGDDIEINGVWYRLRDKNEKSVEMVIDKLTSSPKER